MYSYEKVDIDGRRSYINSNLNAVVLNGWAPGVYPRCLHIPERSESAWIQTLSHMGSEADVMAVRQRRSNNISILLKRPQRWRRRCVIIINDRIPCRVICCNCRRLLRHKPYLQLFNVILIKKRGEAWDLLNVVERERPCIERRKGGRCRKNTTKVQSLDKTMNVIILLKSVIKLRHRLRRQWPNLGFGGRFGKGRSLLTTTRICMTFRHN